jgi:hypothetical protein
VALLDSLAQRYGCRPSDIARSPLWTWQFDLAVALIGADEDAKKNGGTRLLPDPPPEPAKPTTASAAPPAPTIEAIKALASRHGGIQRMAIPDDGIW